MYEHILERTAYNMTYGPFGGVKSKFFLKRTREFVLTCN